VEHLWCGSTLTTHEKYQEGSFSVKSNSIDVGCGETGITSVEYNAPTGAKIIQANACWIDQANIQSSNAVVEQRTETKAKASGIIGALVQGDRILNFSNNNKVLYWSPTQGPVLRTSSSRRST